MGSSRIWNNNKKYKWWGKAGFPQNSGTNSVNLRSVYVFMIHENGWVVGKDEYIFTGRRMEGILGTSTDQDQVLSFFIYSF